MLLLFGLVPAARAFDPKAYILDFGKPPANWTEALSETTLTAHAAVAQGFLACSQEIAFLQARTDFHQVNNHDEENAGEDLLNDLLAKLAWLRNNAGDCTGTLGDTDAVALQQGEDDAFPGNCGGLVQVAAVTIPRTCLIAQINTVLAAMQQGDLQLGSSALPCYLSDPTHLFNGLSYTQTHGEWDASLRVLVRIYFLDHGRRRQIVTGDALTNLHDNLLSVDGSPAQESYSLFQCGNQERSTGSARDRDDEHTWADDALDSVGDLFDWLFKRLLLIAIATGVLAGLAELGASVITSLIAGVATVAIATGVMAVAFLRIPETENHLMQINSSKFLINQVLLDDTSGDEQHHLPSDQSSMRDWLLTKLQSMLQQDFVEYNAMPYQRYTLGAVMNLADFSNDTAVRDAAHLVLEYYLAKYAVGSSELRRYSPFRRRAEILECYDQDNSCGATGPARTVFDLGSGANHATGIMQFFAGPSNAAPANAAMNRLVTTTSTADMLFASTTSYRPQPLTMALALDKSAPFLQRIRLRDGGAEITWSGRAAMITGGGVITDHANSPYLAGITVPGFVASSVSPDGDSDKGAAWPIVVMAPGARADNMYLHHFIRINGERIGVSKNDPAYIYDHNLCIWQGFACGRDLVIPDELAACATVPADGNGWFFVDSGNPNCAASAYAGEHRFYAGGKINKIDGLLDGFIELVDAADAASFEQFVQTLQARNPTVNGIRGVYNTFSGHSVNFDTRGHQINSDRTGIEMVDGVRLPDLDDWVHADGPLSGGWDDASVTITNPGLAFVAGAANLPTRLRLNFSDKHNPHLDVMP